MDSSNMSPDPTGQMARDLCLPWGPVDEKLMEATFHGDPGFFFYCNHGLIYFLWHLQTLCVRGKGSCAPNKDYIHVPKAMGFRIDCPLHEKRFTYHYIYYRWYKTYFLSNEDDVTLFNDWHFCNINGIGMVKPGLKLAVMKAREVLGRGGHRDTAVSVAYNHGWNALATERVPDFADCLFDADEIWAEYRLSEAGKSFARQAAASQISRLGLLYTDICSVSLAEKNSRAIDWQHFIRTGHAYHCSQYIIYQSICQSGTIDTELLTRNELVSYFYFLLLKLQMVAFCKLLSSRNNPATLSKSTT